MTYFDSHAHISSPDVYPQVQSILTRARAAGVNQIMNICTDPSTLKTGLEIATKEKGIYNAGATTPHDVEKEGEEAFPIFEKAARQGNLIAIGETGLDYHYQHSNRKVQQEFLVRYLHLAAELKLPVIFHCREAFEDLFKIVDLEYPKGSPAILHCFTGSIQEAEEVWKRGWMLSISGIATFKKSEALRLVAKETPLSQLLIETDTPYLAPQSMRGKMNEPSYIVETARCIANEKKITLEELAKQTMINAKKVFQLIL
jgi:TatD DNase family protein